MVVVDTSAWIEWLRGTGLGRQFAADIAGRMECVVPTIVQLELAKWMTRERALSESEQIIVYTNQCQVVPLDTRLALLAAELGAEHKLATADAVIYATARLLNADVLTCDAHFSGLKHVRYYAKGKSS